MHLYEKVQSSVFSMDKPSVTLQDVACVLQVGDEESREQLIKTHYMTRVGELTTQLQVSDSKAVHFHSEVKPSLESLSKKNNVIAFA